MQITIRKAVKEDCTRMMELIHELAVYEKEPEAVTVSFDHFVQSGFGDNPVWEAIVAEISPSPAGEGRGEVVGFALWYIRYSTWKGQRLYLEDFLVSEKMRGHGIGKLLFDKLLDDLKALPELACVHFGGFGEPLSHPRILEMLRRCKEMGLAVEMITNGSLLTPVVAGLDAGRFRWSAVPLPAKLLAWLKKLFGG